MRWLASVVGALLGFALGILLVEVVFANNASWPDIVPFALAVFGWLVGRSAVRRSEEQTGRPTPSR